MATIFSPTSMPPAGDWFGPVWIVGDLDLCSAPELLPRLRAVVGDRSGGSLVLDLSRVHYLAVAGVRLLVELRAWLADRDMTLVVRAVSPCACRALVLTDHADLLPARLVPVDRAPVFS